MTTFDEAMLHRERVLDIRVDKYTGQQVKSASFDYGFQPGDAYTTGGTNASSAKLNLDGVHTDFEKLQVLKPELALLVDGVLEWVKMGTFYISDIKIDRNRNTTSLELIDGMFKLNAPYVTELTYPAQIRDVILEIATKTGIELASDDFGLLAIKHHISERPSGERLTFRDVLSQAIQLLGLNAFFDRAGQLAIRGLTDSGLTITADNYFLHGLEKSEIEYQIAGISCKKDKELLTVGLRTGRSLEFSNPFMTQDLLNSLYHNLKNIRYYPYSLKWQGHLKLDVGQWVTLVTNKGETYRVPVFAQSFDFSGGLSSKISAASKAGNDTKYSYGSFLTKKIEQMSTEIEAEVQQQIEYLDNKFDAEFDKAKQAIEDGIEEAKAAAEVVKAEIGAEVEAVAREGQTVKQAVEAGLAEADSKARAFEEAVRDRVALVETKANQVADQARQSDQKANQALTKAGASETLAQTAKQAADRAKTDAAAALARAEAVKQEAIAEAQRLDTVLRTDAENRLATARTELLGKTDQLQTELETAKRSITSQARDILAQAQAQSELTTRLQTVETTANGTKTTVTELSKTLNTATGNLASVTQRVASTETSLAGVRDQYSQLSQTVSGQTGQITAVTRQTADLQRGLEGVTERFEKIRIGTRNLFRNTQAMPLGEPQNGGYNFVSSNRATVLERLPFDGLAPATTAPAEGLTHYLKLSNFTIGSVGLAQQLNLANIDSSFVESFYVRTDGNLPIRLQSRIWDPVSLKFINSDILEIEPSTKWTRVQVGFRLENEGWNGFRIQFLAGSGYATDVCICGLQLERGTIISDYHPNEDDLGQQLATYIRNATENTSRLEQSIQTADGKAEGAKTLAQQTAQGLALKAEKSAVDGLSGRMQSAETSIQAIGGRITTEIAETKALIPTDFGGQNLVRNGAFPTAAWPNTKIAKHNFYFNRQRTLFLLETVSSSEITTSSERFSVKRNTEYTLTFVAFAAARVKSSDVWFLAKKNDEPADFTSTNQLITARKFASNRAEYVTVTFNSGDNDSGYIRFDNNGSSDGQMAVMYFGEVMLVEGRMAHRWTPALEDMTSEIETVKTTITQTSEGQQQLSRRLSETQDKVTTAETKITQLIGDVGSKVSQVEFDRVKSRVDSQQTAITQNSSAIALKAEKTYVDGVKSTADSAKAIADGLKTTSATKAELKVVSDGITLLATKTDVDGVTGRLTTAEASIRTQAEQIAQRLTSSQVESAITAKGYQTKAQVDANITGRGYITNAALAGYVPTTSFDNYKTETAQAIERGLTATRALILTEVGGRNLASIVDSVEGYRVLDGNQYPCYQDTNHRISKLIDVSPGEALSVKSYSEKNVVVSIGFFDENKNCIQRPTGYITVNKGWHKVYKAPPNSMYVAISWNRLADGHIKLERGNVSTDWSPAPEDMVTSVDFNRVKETAQLYERVIGRSEGDIQANVARQVLTSQLYQTEVKSPLADLATRVTQLNDSYAIQVLGSSSRILTEINANASGLRLAGKLIHLDGTVTANDAFFRSVLADKIEAGNIKAGAVTTAKIVAGAVTADHLLVNQAMIDKLVTNSVWADRLFAQSAFMAKLQATKILAGQIDAGLINTAMLATDSVTADKLVVNQALFTKLMANEAYLRQLFAKQAFITQVQAVELSASKITSGLIDASRISVINLDANQIKSGTIDVSMIKGLDAHVEGMWSKLLSTDLIVDKMGQLEMNLNRKEIKVNGALSLLGDSVRTLSHDRQDGWLLDNKNKTFGPYIPYRKDEYKVEAGDFILWSSPTYGGSVSAMLQSIINCLGSIKDVNYNLADSNLRAVFNREVPAMRREKRGF